MTKAEILEAINATIAPNGVKGITAESLANILIEMVNATPESSGGGEFYTLAIADNFGEEPLTEEQQAHNAELYRKLTEVDFMSPTAVPPVFCAGMPTLIEYSEGVLSFILSIPAGMNADYTLQGICLLITLNEDGSVIVENMLNE